MLQQRFAGFGGLDPPALAREQFGAYGVLKLREPLADGRPHDVGALAGAGNVAGLADGDEETQGGDVEVAHGGRPG
ncbi:hypothetical protein D3C75_1243410 [compost metagenome]